MSAHHVPQLTPPTSTKTDFHEYESTTPARPADLSTMDSDRRYYLKVDPEQNDRAVEINLFSFKRPHMRAFHYSWFGFFLAFTGWFAIPPLVPYIKKDLHLVNKDIDTSNITAVSGTILARLALGPLCDIFGSRVVFSTLLVLCSVPVGLVGLVSSAVGLQIIRFVIGFVGAAFVCCQFWTMNMFASNIVGTGNALAGGWGNMGAGFTALVLPLVYDLFHDVFDVSSAVSWRVVVALPALIMLVTGICMYFFTDDCPKGNYKDIVRPKSEKVSGTKAFTYAAANHNTLLLAVIYAACFGVELMVDNALPQYMYEDFVKKNCDPAVDGTSCKIFSSVTSAGVVASIFGLMNLFSRPSGGFISDLVARRWGMKGRLYVLFTLVLLEGLFLILFSRLHEAWSGILVLIIFSYCCQAACGAAFGVVPSVLPKYSGAVSGIVGAGGNVGAMSWGFLFRYIGNKRKGFLYMGFIVTAISFCALFIYIKGHSSILFNAAERKRLDKEEKDTCYDDPTVHVDSDLKSRGDETNNFADMRDDIDHIRIQPTTLYAPMKQH